EALEPAALFAEIVHLPEGRIGNVLCRPVLRPYEIPYLGQAGADPHQQIPLTDLLVSVVGNRIVLRSQQLGRRVIPRLTTAHNYASRSLGIYKFLCSLQNQEVAGALRWDWGAFDSADFLPRVTYRRLVLARARWRLSDAEIGDLVKSSSASCFQTLQALRSERRLPRHLLLVDHDNLLPVDLDNILSIEAFVDELKGRSDAILVEQFPGPDELCANGPEGRFVHEIVVPFTCSNQGADAQQGSLQRADQVGAQPARPAGDWPIKGASLPPVAPIPRWFAPHSEWLYAKLYTGSATADQVLCEVVGPVVRAALQDGAADHWFFLRYADPDWHLRLRFHGEAERLYADLLPALHQAVAPLLADGRLWRVQLDTYVREIERYGGPQVFPLAERLFHADSEAALAIVERLDGDAGADARWRLALVGVDWLLNDLGYDLAAKQAVIRRARDSFLREFGADGKLRSQLGEKHRRERQDLSLLLDQARTSPHALDEGLALLRQRSLALAPVAAALRRAERDHRLTRPLAEIAWSYLHMHANRLLRANQRTQELVLYDLLDRHYQTLVARQR
nr:thiopeptide-type bacteriocin biosynthesis protein [Caldilineaceae bacterium]